MTTQQAVSRPSGNEWLSRMPEWFFVLFAGTMAFGTFFSMYAFRKPFAAAAFTDGPDLLGLPFKVALVIAQVSGYAIAKCVGVKVIAELPARHRVSGIVIQIAAAELALVLFAIVPSSWKVVCLLLNGFSLGMVWGMVFAFVEGRRQSDVIGAMLCASFAVASGFVKSVGQSLLNSGYVDEWWMPAATGLVFVPILGLCVSGLAILPPPSAADQAARVMRAPMNAADRRQFVRRFGTGLAALVLIHVMLTALRDLRDNFASDIWSELGLGGRAELFTWTEIPIALMVLGTFATLSLFQDNRRALSVTFILIACGLSLAGLASTFFAMSWIGPVIWMVLLGGGLYLAYTPFNGLLFDRLVAASGSVANAGFLIYVADSFGYSGSVGLLLLRNVPELHMAWSSFLCSVSIASSLVGLLLLGWASHVVRARLR